MSDSLFRELPLLDRSTLETCANCPRQHAYIQRGGFGSAGDAAASGEAVHSAIGATITDYIDAEHTMGTSEIRDVLMQHVYRCRPDVQPDAVEAVQRYAWRIASIIGDVAPPNILRYDGGQGDRSGQLAADLGDGRLTAEMDLLCATASGELLALHDWKTGRKFWTETDVGSSFQFQFYSYLVLANYPDVNCVRVTVHNTRSAAASWSVEFCRRDMPQWEGRILTAVDVWERYGDLAPADAPAWPTRDKCRVCDAAASCEAPDPDIREAHRDPQLYLQQSIQIEQRLRARMKHLSAIVESSGQDIVTSEGDCYGFGAPPASKRKPGKKLYSVTTDDTDE